MIKHKKDRLVQKGFVVWCLGSRDSTVFKCAVNICRSFAVKAPEDPKDVPTLISDEKVMKGVYSIFNILI